MSCDALGFQAPWLPASSTPRRAPWPCSSRSSWGPTRWSTRWRNRRGRRPQPPPYIGLQGGRGVATGWGALLVLAPIIALLIVPLFVALLLITRISSVASLTCSLVGGLALLAAIPIAGCHRRTPCTRSSGRPDLDLPRRQHPAAALRRGAADRVAFRGRPGRARRPSRRPRTRPPSRGPAGEPPQVGTGGPRRAHGTGGPRGTPGAARGRPPPRPNVMRPSRSTRRPSGAACRSAATTAAWTSPRTRPARSTTTTARSACGAATSTSSPVTARRTALPRWSRSRSRSARTVNGCSSTAATAAGR